MSHANLPRQPEKDRSRAPTDKKQRIVLTTFGSLGDLHPYIALALGLQARGHEVVIATSPFYRQKIEALGIGFRPVRPDHPDLAANPDLVKRLMDHRRGTECVVREMVMPVLGQSYEDTLAAAQGADLLLSHPLTFTTRLVAEKKDDLRAARSVGLKVAFIPRPSEGDLTADPEFDVVATDFLDLARQLGV